jgi:hypothetical protein
MSFIAPIWEDGYAPSAEEWNALWDALKTGLNVALQFRGVWSAQTTYDENDVARFSGAFYVALQASTGSQPDTAPLDWAVLGGAPGIGSVADGSITTAKIADGSITTAKIASGAVTADKLSATYINSVQAQINDLPTLEEVDEIALEAAQNAFEAGENISFTPVAETGKIQISATGDLAATLARATASVTTSNLANSATDSSKEISLGRSAWVMRVVTSAPAWVRLYSSALAQQSDAARLISEFPPPGLGIVLDVVTTPGHLTIDLSPMAQVANLEAVPSTNYRVTVKNLSGAAQSITVTLTKITIEL